MSHDRPPRTSLAQAVFSRAILPVGLVTPALAPWLWPASPALAIGAIVGSHLPLFYGTFLPNRQSFGPVITRFAGAPDEVWLTIDDGPDPRDTPQILDELDARDAKATFFVRGDRARAYPQLIQEILRRGHSVGNHTYSHPHGTFWGLPPSRIGAEMDRCNEVLRDIGGAAPGWFRAPVGMINPFVHRAAHARGMRVIGWSARAFDAAPSPPSVTRIVERIERDLAPGRIALLHEATREPCAACVRLLLERLYSRGLRAVTPQDDSLRSR